MAGSHTMMPGIIYTNAVLNVTNNSSSIPVVANMTNQQPIIIPISSVVANNAISINGHTNGILSSANILRPANKLIIQGTPANFLPNRASTSMQSNHLVNNSINSTSQASNNVVDRSTGHYHIGNKLIEDANKVKAEIPEVQEIKLEEEEVQEIVQEEEPVIDIMINNVVCSFSLGCHLDLRNIALTAHNVEFRKENGMVTLKIRRPMCTASIWSSGKISCTGSTSEEQARIAARRVARCMQKLGYKVRFRNYRVVNVLGTCSMPFAIRITQFSQKHRKAACYEPELHPGVTYRIESPKATLKIFSTGSITVTAPSVSNVQSAIEIIYPLVKEFGKKRTPEEISEMRRIRKKKQLDYESINEDGHSNRNDSCDPF